jgi:hypothetical protein
MQNRRPPQPHRGNTAAQQGPAQEATPRLPHERDESADSQSDTDASAQRAPADLVKGQQDTGKAPTMDRLYARLKAKG